MLMPANCPICQEPLFNDFKDKPSRHAFGWQKTCSKKLDHFFYCAAKTQDDTEVYFISTSFGSNRQIVANWILPTQDLVITGKISGNRIPVPWVEPDFSNYRNLVKKLKTCLVFS